MFLGQEKNFLFEIINNHADDGIRLIYADWLDENNREGEAELIRVQIELSRRTRALVNVKLDGYIPARREKFVASLYEYGVLPHPVVGDVIDWIDNSNPDELFFGTGKIIEDLVSLDAFNRVNKIVIQPIADQSEDVGRRLHLQSKETSLLYNAYSKQLRGLKPGSFATTRRCCFWGWLTGQPKR